MPPQHHTISEEQAGQTLAQWLRALLPEQSWNAIRRFIATRHVKLGSDLCLDPARRLKAGESIEVHTHSLPKLRRTEEVALRHVDEHVVVVEKPSGLSTVRHPAERDWAQQRKELAPTLEDIVPRLLAAHEQRPTKGKLARLRVVQRLDKETSGLIVFARSVDAERSLGHQFHAHTVLRRYLAIVPGHPRAQRLATRLMRDRGDGRRGSTSSTILGKEAVTHVTVEEKLPAHTLLACRLETGRTHQIRIHLAELGHPVCGESVYTKQDKVVVCENTVPAPRLALHAVDLGFVHPITSRQMSWTMPLPTDLAAYLELLRNLPM